MAKTSDVHCATASDSSWEEFHDPARFALVAERHRNAFAWQRQGWIPLGIHVVNPDYTLALDYGRWLDPEPFFDAQTHILRDTLAVGSDLLPAMAINHLGSTVVPSMFGAELFMPDKGGATLQDVGPTPFPVLADMDELDSLAMPTMDDGILPAARRIVSHYRRHLPSWIHVVAPMPGGPFSTAMEVRGSDLLVDLVDRPDECHRLLDRCASLQVEVERDLRRLSGEPIDRHVTNFGILGTGLRLGEDSIVNLSPAMIHEFCLPAFDLINRACGGRGHVHFCSLEHSRFEHLYPALAEAENVAVISSQFGFEYYEQHVDELRGRLAVECYYGDALAYCTERYGSFEQWAASFVPRFKNESGLVMYMQAASVEEGRRYWRAWEQAHAA